MSCPRLSLQLPGPRRGTALDGAVILDDYRIVVDDRVPGDSPAKMQQYECGKCHRTEWSEVVPECCGRKMSLKKLR
jgi:hypothetical protein